MQVDPMKVEKSQVEKTQAERLRLVEELFHGALERAPNEQAAFLAEASAGDETLRREVESLLAAHEQTTNGLEEAVGGLAAEWAEEQKPRAAGPRRLGPYKLLSLLGKGGMGEVHLAHDTRLGRKVALKLLPPEFTDHKDRLRRFEQEARAASSLNHPNIITIYEIGQVDDTHFIASEFVEGQTLRRRLNSGQVTLRDALDLAIQVAGALAAAHAVGVTHRDIKPENLMVRPDGLVKVLDFGLAKLTEPRAVLAADALTAPEAQTEPGVVMGTARYMSPEQARGQELDGRTDIFSLGAALYEMIAGQPPFDGATTIDTLAAMLNQEPAPLTQYNDAVPEELDRIVSKALRKDREERYQSAGELLADLKDLRQELELEARLARSDGRLGVTTTPRQRPGQKTSRIEVTQTGARQAVRATAGFKQFFSRVKSRRTGLIGAIVALALAALAGFGYLSGKDPREVNSLAVLPFVNSGADPEVEYLCDGLTESLINRLSQLSRLKVMSRGAAFRYKGRDVDARAVGQELGVEVVLTGKVTQRGDELLIQVDLVDTTDNSQIWGERYSRRRAGVLAEEEIAQEISLRLRPELSAGERQRLVRRYTANTEAYHLYLHGRYIWNKRRRQDYPKAIEYYNQALEKDPAYALAYVGLADCYVLGAGAASGAEAFSKAKAAALKALEIDETLAEAHATLGAVKMFYEWDLRAAETEFKRAIALSPNYPSAYQWYADALTVTGRAEEALGQMRQAQELDPLALSVIRDAGRIYYYTRRFEEAARHCRKALELDPGFYPAVMTLGDTLLQQKNYREAVANYQRAVDLSRGMGLMRAMLAHAYAASGQGDEAQKILDDLIAGSQKGAIPAFDVAVVYTGMGRKDEALEWLEKAYRERSYRLVYAGVDPLFDPLRSDERFKDLLRRIGLPPE
jgi:serine/threonine-protein kinase